MAIAAVSVVSSGLQQIFVRTMQQKHKLSAHELLSNTAPAQVRRARARCRAVHRRARRLGSRRNAWHLGCARQPTSRHFAPPGPHHQAWSLLLVGPFLDKLASADWVFSYSFTGGGQPRQGRAGVLELLHRLRVPAMLATHAERWGQPAALLACCPACPSHLAAAHRPLPRPAAASVVMAASCALAVLVNVSQFMCLGRFSAVSFQVGGRAGGRTGSRRGPRCCAASRRSCAASRPVPGAQPCTRACTHPPPADPPRRRCWGTPRRCWCCWAAGPSWATPSRPRSLAAWRWRWRAWCGELVAGRAVQWGACGRPGRTHAMHPTRQTQLARLTARRCRAAGSAPPHCPAPCQPLEQVRQGQRHGGQGVCQGGQGRAGGAGGRAGHGQGRTRPDWRAQRQA